MTDPKPDGYTDLDHRTMRVPHLRLVGERHPGIFLWAIRLAQPNLGLIPAASMHSLEHLLLNTLCETDPGFALAAPMGCMTGLYWTTGTGDNETATGALSAALSLFDNFTDTPGADPIHCGAFRRHDFTGALSIGRWMLSQQATWHDYGGGEPFPVLE